MKLVIKCILISTVQFSKVLSTKNHQINLKRLINFKTREEVSKEYLNKTLVKMMSAKMIFAPKIVMQLQIRHQK